MSVPVVAAATCDAASGSLAHGHTPGHAQVHCTPPSLVSVAAALAAVAVREVRPQERLLGGRVEPLVVARARARTGRSVEQRDLRPGRATNWPSLLTQLNNVRRNNKLYSRLISAGAGTVVGGETLPGLPAGVRSVLDTDPSVASSTVTRAVVGTWEQKLDRVVRGSREITITLTAKQ